MSLKNLSAKSKIPSRYKKILLNKRVGNVFKKFETLFNPDKNFIVAVSGGADSLALAFLTKLYAYKNNLRPKYFIIDHRLRKESKNEALKVKKILRSYEITANILSWKGKKPSGNLQSHARKKRYQLLFSMCKKFEINNLVLGHHIDDLFENFFLRLLRGSGLKGLISLGYETQIKSINILRPLINFEKKDLIFVSNFVFGFYVKDPSNLNTKFNRIKIRNLMPQLEKIGLDKKKFQLTIENLKSSDCSIKFYVEKNKKENSFMNLKKKELILKEGFFDNSYEIIHRSLSDLIQIVGKKESPVRGKKIGNILSKIKNKRFIKETLGGCVIKMTNQTIILTKEH